MTQWLMAWQKLSIHLCSYIWCLLPALPRTSSRGLKLTVMQWEGRAVYFPKAFPPQQKFSHLTELSKSDKKAPHCTTCQQVLIHWTWYGISVALTYMYAESTFQQLSLRGKAENINEIEKFFCSRTLPLVLFWPSFSPCVFIHQFSIFFEFYNCMLIYHFIIKALFICYEVIK